jgi:hypothetical protein
MKRISTLILLILEVFAFTLSAQTVITAKTNLMQSGDVLNLKKIDTISPGESGANRTWDYSGTKIIGDFSIRYNRADNSKDNGFFACDENGEKTSYYQTTSSQTTYSGLSTDKVKIEFSEPTVEMKYPFEFGSQISGQMNGKYTENQYTLPITGTYYSVADGWGTLILPNGVKLNNVLRVHYLRDYTHEFSGSDYHFIINRYAFYAPGERYPVLQIKQAVYDCINCACDGKDFLALYNPEVKQEESKPSSALSVSFKYKAYPNPVEGDFYVDYEIKKAAKVRISILDLMGRELKVLTNQNQPAGNYSLSTNMQSFHASNFVLKMVVDDVVYSEKIIKKECSGKH